ncbi:ABC transporter permease [Orrella marina]|uniref:ABC transporter permease n=1 Tax=Orrella marina TaxID=2163011 RepID=A0A2R4XNH4_9BURK|nr:ABC transporter permease [Orrella marina]AWB35318.1 ABC transporter permease [Orrella marina]
MVDITSTQSRVATGSWVSCFERHSFVWVFGILAVFSLVLLLAPTVVVIVASFTSSYSLRFPPPGYSTRWYEALWTQSPEILNAIVLSLKVASISTGISIVLAVAATLALARRREQWARAVEAMFLSPLMLPTLALGLALLMLFNLAGFGLSFWTLIIGHVAITAPYIVRTTSASLVQLDKSLLESARSLGASSGFTFRTVTLPLILPGIAAGAFIAFMYSFDNVAVSLFLSDARSEVLPIRMWHIIESNLDVRAAAVSGVLIGATVVLMLVMERLIGVSRHIR